MIAEAVKHMLAAGMQHDAIVAAIQDMEASALSKRSSGAERQARYRERKNKHITSDACDVTLRNSVTERNENSDKEENTLRNLKEEINIPVKEKPPKGGKKKKHPLPENFVFAGSVYETGTNLGLTGSQIENEFASMRDWAKAKNGLMADWDAFAKNWLRRNANQARASPMNFQKNGSSSGEKHDKHSLSQAIGELREATRKPGSEDFGAGNGIVIDVTPRRGPCPA
jgi:hypothetical protein